MRRYVADPRFYFTFQRDQQRHTLILLKHRDFWICAKGSFQSMNTSEDYCCGTSPEQALTRYLVEWGADNWFDPQVICG